MKIKKHCVCLISRNFLFPSTDYTKAPGKNWLATQALVIKEHKALVIPIQHSKYIFY